MWRVRVLSKTKKGKQALIEYVWSCSEDRKFKVNSNKKCYRK